MNTSTVGASSSETRGAAGRVDRVGDCEKAEKEHRDAIALGRHQDETRREVERQVDRRQGVANRHNR